jgi:hypothetical protein
MRRHKSGFVTTGLAAVLGISSVPDAALSAGALQSPVPAYNPYPPGILPPDLDSEIGRVQRTSPRQLSGIMKAGVACDRELIKLRETR